jgi:hypothetical protein
VNATGISSQADDAGAMKPAAFEDALPRTPAASLEPLAKRVDSHEIPFSAGRYWDWVSGATGAVPDGG